MRSGRIGEHVAREKSRSIDAAYEEGEHGDTVGHLDPILYPDEQ